MEGRGRGREGSRIQSNKKVNHLMEELCIHGGKTGIRRTRHPAETAAPTLPSVTGNNKHNINTKLTDSINITLILIP